MKTVFLSRRIAFLLTLCMVLVGTSSAETTEPRMVIHHYPQRIDRGVLDWNSPVLVAYNDDSIIWRREWAQSLTALTIGRSQRADAAIRKLGELVAAHNGKTFVLSASSDPERTVVWYLGKRIEILGSWEKPFALETGDPANASQVASVNENERKLWATLPAEIRETLSELKAFDDPEGRTWRPEKVSLTFWPGGTALGEAMEWPKEWPRSFVKVPDSPELKRIELPGSMLDCLASTLGRDGLPRAVMINGKRSYAKIRLVFPGEDAWKTQ